MTPVGATGTVFFPIIVSLSGHVAKEAGIRKNAAVCRPGYISVSSGVNVTVFNGDEVQND